MGFEHSGIKHFDTFEKFDLGLGTGFGSGRDLVNLQNGNHVLEFEDFVLPFYNLPLVFYKLKMPLLTLNVIHRRKR